MSLINNILKIKILVLIIILSLSQKVISDISIDANYVILQDHHSGKILYEKDADTKIYPASMTKIMTTIVTFDLIRKGETTLDEMITISENAWRLSQSGYSSMFIMLNDEVSVEDLLKGIIIVSGNDACVALAEGLTGSEENFVMLMNEKAQEIGLNDTNFANTSGINNPDNYSTVRDIMIMSRYLIKNYPEFYTYYKEKTFTWDRTGGDPITQGNRNPLLYKNIGVDGIKTGFLTVEKYSLASSIKKGERRLIAVGSGFPTKNARSKESAKLLGWGLRNFDTVQVAKKNKTITNLNVWLGKKHSLEVSIDEDIYFTIPRRKKNTIKAVVSYNEPLRAPIKKGDKVALLNIYILDELVKSVDVIANENVKKNNIIARIFKKINFLVWGDV
jgi:serine-type D-Ala-D-Ala carboxypeptidase (penicillin-binding protein 5/6)